MNNTSGPNASVDPLPPTCSLVGTFPDPCKDPLSADLHKSYQKSHVPPYFSCRPATCTCLWPELIQRSVTNLVVCKRAQPGPVSLQNDSYLGERKRYNTHHSNCLLSSGLGANICSDCRPYPQTKASQGTTQENHPAFGITDLWQKQPQTSPLTTQGSNPVHGAKSHYRCLD